MEKSNPLISIIMPVYNGEFYLADSIESIMTQTFRSWELIIVDDSSNDTSKIIASRYAARDARILVISNTQEKGLAGALNCGLKRARGSYIARADADDLNVPERIQIEYTYLKTHPSIDIVGSWYETFGNDKQPKIRKHPSTSIVIAWKYLSNTYFCHPTILFRKRVLDTIPYYPLVVCEDFAFLSKCIHLHRGHNISQVLLHYREHATNYSTTKAQSIKESVLETYRENYTFYGGKEYLTDAFYQFHALYRISFRTFFSIVSEAFKIGKKMLRNYHLQKNIPAILTLVITIKIHLFKSIGNSIVRTLLKK